MMIPNKATVASTMYDMSRVNANGYFDAEDSADDRNKKREMIPNKAAIATDVRFAVFILLLLK